MTVEQIQLKSTIRSYVESHYPMLYLVMPEDVEADGLISALAEKVS